MMTQGIWPAVLGRFDWHALPFVRAWENPTASEIIGAGAASEDFGQANASIGVSPLGRMAVSSGTSSARVSNSR